MAMIIQVGYIGRKWMTDDSMQDMVVAIITLLLKVREAALILSMMNQKQQCLLIWMLQVRSLINGRIKEIQLIKVLLQKWI